MISKELQAALDAAEAAAVIIRSMYQRNLAVHTKADATPVTEADVQAEEAIRAILTERFPSYGFYGEETGQHAIDARERLARRSDRRHEVLRARVPVLLDADRADARRPAACSAFRARRRMASWRGRRRARGAYLNGRPIHVSADRASSASAIVSTGNLKTLARSPQWTRLRRPDRRASTAFAATAISCTTTCSRAARWMW